MNSVVHFEIPYDDAERAKGFYGSTFGWDIQTWSGEQEYTIARTTAVDERQMPTEPGAINGGLTKRSGEMAAPLVTIAVASISETLKKIHASGGDVVAPRQEIPGMGAYAYFRDSEGNVLGLWETAEG